MQNQEGCAVFQPMYCKPHNSQGWWWTKNLSFCLESNLRQSQNPKTQVMNYNQARQLCRSKNMSWTPWHDGNSYSCC